MVSTKREKPQATSNSDAARELRSYAQRIVNLEGERKSLAEDIKGIKNEAAGRGFDKKALMVIVQRMRETAEERAARIEAEDIAEVYLASLGMLDGTPLGESARRRFDPLERDDDAGEGELPASAADNRQDDTTAPTAPPSGAMSEEAIAAARDEGGEAAAAGERVFANPYVAGDPRRAAWDEGWCARKGSDGMEIPDAWRRKKKPAAGDEAAEKDAQS